jgi:4-carboxymuconolactone decarboxylase
VRLAASIAAADESVVRNVMAEAHSRSWNDAIEEVILQSYLFCGLPRALNAARAWRSISGVPAPAAASKSYDDIGAQRRLGEATCAQVYGASYERLRENIRQLHPDLDEWMIVEGYGKVLSRPQLDLPTRELCIVAACAATAQKRQLQSHIRGALNAGAPASAVEATLDAIADLVNADAERDARDLLAKVTRD